MAEVTSNFRILGDIIYKIVYYLYCVLHILYVYCKQFFINYANSLWTKIIDIFPTPPTHPAFENNLIIRNIFSLLEIDDLKNSRLVNRQWLANGETDFRKRTRICFHFSRRQIGPKYEKRPVYSNPIPDDISDYFQSCYRGVPLDSLALRTGEIYWSEQELRNFFHQKSDAISDLILEWVSLTDEDDERLEKLESLDLFGVNLLCNLKVLHIRQYFSNKETRFTIPLNLVQNIEELNLDECTVVIDEAKKIRPQKLSLRINTFVRGPNRSKAGDVLLNDFVNFEKLKELKCWGTIDYGCDLSVDMRNNHKLDSVLFVDTKLIGWANSNWSVRCLQMPGRVDLTYLLTNSRNLKMNIKEIQGRFTSFEIVQCLPPSLERLVIYALGNSNNSDGFDPQYQFPNLKFLKIEIFEKLSLSIFKICPNLTDLEIIEYVEGEDMDVDLIPNTVKNLQLWPGVYLSADWVEKSSKSRKFERIVVRSLENWYLSRLITEFDPAELFIDVTEEPSKLHVYPNGEAEWESENKGTPISSKFLKKILLAKSSTRIMIGKLKWGSSSFAFLTSPLYPYVDKKSEYYCFENGRGISMAEEEFVKISKFKSNSPSDYIRFPFLN